MVGAARLRDRLPAREGQPLAVRRPAPALGSVGTPWGALYRGLEGTPRAARRRAVVLVLAVEPEGARALAGRRVPAVGRQAPVAAVGRQAPVVALAHQQVVLGRIPWRFSMSTGASRARRTAP